MQSGGTCPFHDLFTNMFLPFASTFFFEQGRKTITQTHKTHKHKKNKYMCNKLIVYYPSKRNDPARPIT